MQPIVWSSTLSNSSALCCAKSPSVRAREKLAITPGFRRSRRGAPETAGDILAASNADGRALMQFTGLPLPFVSAQLTADGGWQVEFIPKKSYAGQGAPPERLIWVQLVRALNGLGVPASIEFIKSDNGGWRLLNRESGESVTGFFNP